MQCCVVPPVGQGRANTISTLTYLRIIGNRYFFILRVRSYYRPLLADSTLDHNDDSTDAETTTTNAANIRRHQQRVTALGRTILALNHLILFTFIAGLTVICLRAIVDGVWSGTLLVLYNVMTLVAFSANLFLMLVEVGKGGQWSWANYGFWWLSLAGESFIGWYHLESLPEGKKEKKDKEKKSSKNIPMILFLFFCFYVYTARLSENVD